MFNPADYVALPPEILKRKIMKICDKQDYKTRKIAKTSAHVMKLKGVIPPRVNLIPYYCDKCKSWHLTHITVTEYINKVAKTLKK